MRLGQLSRKISIQPSRIMSFLESKDFELTAGSNTKLTEDQVLLVKSHFDIKEEVDNSVEEVAPEEVVIEAVVQLEETDPSETPEFLSDSEDEVDETEETNQDLEEDTPQEMEVIRAPKLKLEGLTVVGKIDLPTPKLPEVVEETETEEKNQEKATDPPKQGRRPTRKDNSRNKRTKRSRPSLEEREVRAELARQREHKKQKEVQKKERQRRYNAKMQQRKAFPEKTKKQKQEVNIEVSTSSYKNPVGPAPKTWWGRFMRWLNT